MNGTVVELIKLQCMRLCTFLNSTDKVIAILCFTGYNGFLQSTAHNYLINKKHVILIYIYYTLYR